MNQQSERDKFKARLEERRSEGLTDIKFFVGDLSESTHESFYREANAIDDAMESGRFTEIDWKGSPEVYSK